MLMNIKFKAQTLTGNPSGNYRCQLLAARALNMSCSFNQSARSIESWRMVMRFITHNKWHTWEKKSKLIGILEQLFRRTICWCESKINACRYLYFCSKIKNIKTWNAARFCEISLVVLNGVIWLKSQRKSLVAKEPCKKMHLTLYSALCLLMR